MTNCNKLQQTFSNNYSKQKLELSSNYFGITTYYLLKYYVRERILLISWLSLFCLPCPRCFSCFCSVKTCWLVLENDAHVSFCCESIFLVALDFIVLYDGNIVSQTYVLFSLQQLGIQITAW